MDNDLFKFKLYEMNYSSFNMVTADREKGSLVVMKQNGYAFLSLQ